MSINIAIAQIEISWRKLSVNNFFSSSWFKDFFHSLWRFFLSHSISLWCSTKAKIFISLIFFAQWVHFAFKAKIFSFLLLYCVQGIFPIWWNLIKNSLTSNARNSVKRYIFYSSLKICKNFYHHRHHHLSIRISSTDSDDGQAPKSVKQFSTFSVYKKILKFSTIKCEKDAIIKRVYCFDDLIH